MQRPVKHSRGGRQVERAGQVGAKPHHFVESSRSTVAHDDVERFGGHELFSKVGCDACPACPERQGQGRMGQIGRNQRFELGLQPVYLLGWQVQPEHFDGNEAFFFGVVGTEDGTKSSSPDLMQHTKWTEGVGGVVRTASVCSAGLL